MRHGSDRQNWCCQHFDVLPDLMAFGKKAQVCGVMAGPRLDEVKDNAFRLPSRLNSTWGGNFTDMVRSTHFLRIIEEENLVENAREIGDVFPRSMHEIADGSSDDYRGARARSLHRFRSARRRKRAMNFGRVFRSGVLVLRSGETLHSVSSGARSHGRSCGRSYGLDAKILPATR